MKRNHWIDILSPLLLPVLLMLLGIILIVNPDSAAALIGRLIAFALIVAGTVMGVAALSGDTLLRVRRLIPAAILLALGLWLLANPLFIARSLGRILGILLILEGGGTLGGELRLGHPLPVVAAITLVAGIVLVLVPMTTSRLLIIGCGIAVLCLGAAELAQRLLRRRLPRNRDIIDQP